MPIKKPTKQEASQQLYDRLRETSEIPVTESADIFSKGLYVSEQGKREILIKQSLAIKEKLHVALHEYSHYVHLSHYFKQESRAECELIANGAAFVVCKEHELNAKEVDLTKFTDDADTVTRLTDTIQSVAGHILVGLNQE